MFVYTAYKLGKLREFAGISLNFKLDKMIERFSQDFKEMVIQKHKVKKK